MIKKNLYFQSIIFIRDLETGSQKEKLRIFFKTNKKNSSRINLLEILAIN